MRKSRRLILLTFLFAISLSGILVGSFALKNSMDFRSRADFYDPNNCTDDPSSFDYCGDTAPFRGCVGGGEWICMCRLPNKKWWSECSVIEQVEVKQKYKDQCGGDEQKAFSQWKYDVAMGETRGQCSCGGQNVCPAPTPVGGKTGGGGGGGGNFPPGEKPPPLASPVIDTPIPTPTLTYRLGTGPVAPTTVFVPPTNAPFYREPTVIYQPPGSAPEITPTPVSKPLINIDIKRNIQVVSDFVAKTQKSLADFFSKVLP